MRYRLAPEVPMLRSRSLALAVSALLVASPASAVPIVEDAALAAIAMQTAASLISLGTIIDTGIEALETAQQTSAFLRSASEVVVDLAYLSQNPDEIFDQAQQSFALSFPEIDAIARDAQAIRDNLSSVGAPPQRTVLDLMAHARETDSNAYQAVMSFNNLTYGMLNPYLEQIRLLERTANEAGAIRMQATGPLDAKTAAVLTAKAAANAATTLNSIAATNLEIARIQQQQYLEQQEAEAKAALRNRQAADRMPSLFVPETESLSSEEF